MLNDVELPIVAWDEWPFITRLRKQRAQPMVKDAAKEDV